MKRPILGLLALPIILGLAACDQDDLIYYDDNYAAPPENLAAWYYDEAVYVTWELAPAWDEDAFRVYAKRISGAFPGSKQLIYTLINHLIMKKLRFLQ